MQSTLNALASSPEFALTGFAVGLVSLIAAVLFYSWGKRERRPYFQTATTVLVEANGNHPADLTFTYQGLPQTRITVTKVAFWNAGREVINALDMTEADPLRIEFGNATVLDAKVIKFSAESCRFCVSKAGLSEVRVVFDYVDSNDYAVIQVVHTGGIDTQIDMTGKIKGSPRIRRHTDPATSDLVTNNLLKFVNDTRSMERYLRVVLVLFPALGLWQLIQGNRAWYIWLFVLLTSFYLICSVILLRDRCPVKLR